MSPPKLHKCRLDQLLVDGGYAPTLERARALLISGQVLVDDRPGHKAGDRIADSAIVRLRHPPAAFVSRGGNKLDQALRHFAVDVEGRVAIDVGASTGGFTDCLLQRGAAKVYAVDVGYGQLAHKLRIDPRVVVMERVNIRELRREQLSEAPELAVADVSFISLEKALAPLRDLLSPIADLVVLIKPQFEADKGTLPQGGVLRDQELRAQTIERAVATLCALGFEFRQGTDCDTHGPRGNVEYLAWLGWRS